MTISNIYRFTIEDLKCVFEFTKKYHLEETKQSSGRTNQGSRNFGGELDAFIPGKLIELAVCKILESNRNDKKLSPDYKIYTNTKVAEKVDPDIIEVYENQESRPPKIHVEIKRLSDGDVWLGMRADQLKRVETVKGKNTLQSMYMIHASLGFSNSFSKKRNDIVGSVLKEFIPVANLNLKEFSSFKDLYCKIEFAYSVQNLMSKGNLYEKGDIIPTGEFHQSANAYNGNGAPRKGYKLIKHFPNGNHHIQMKIELNGKEPNYGFWEVIGDVQLFITANGKELLHCKSDSIMKNRFFGSFKLDSGKTYQFFLQNKMGKNYKNIDDFWFFKNRLNEMITLKEIPSTEDVIHEIILSI
jgi:hypothetical protein